MSSSLKDLSAESIADNFVKFMAGLGVSLDFAESIEKKLKEKYSKKWIVEKFGMFHDKDYTVLETISIYESAESAIKHIENQGHDYFKYGLTIKISESEYLYVFLDFCKDEPEHDISKSQLDYLTENNNMLVLNEHLTYQEYDRHGTISSTVEDFTWSFSDYTIYRIFDSSVVDSVDMDIYGDHNKKLLHLCNY